MDLGLNGKVALVTGAGSGIGWQIARTLLLEKATVIATSEEQTQLDSAVARFDVPDAQVSAYAADLTDPSAVERLRNQAAEVGTIDILVNCAGTSGASGPFDQIDDVDWMQTLSTDLMTAVRLTRACLPDLRSSGRGRVVFLTSENAVQPYPDEIPYDAAKAALLATAKGLSRSYADDGLLVNCVSPAFIHTPMTDEMMDQRCQQLGVGRDEAISSFLQDKRPTLVLRRRGEPEEVAAVVAFLCSERASFVTGSDYRVDGGSVAAIN